MNATKLVHKFRATPLECNAGQCEIDEVYSQSNADIYSKKQNRIILNDRQETHMHQNKTNDYV